MPDNMPDGWYSGDLRCHYVKDGKVLCNSRIKPGTPAHLDEERKYCHRCAAKVRQIRKRHQRE